jgi:hypothetical protein
MAARLSRRTSRRPPFAEQIRLYVPLPAELRLALESFRGRDGALRTRGIGCSAMDLGLAGRVALVTGVSYGIGAATAIALISEGMQVFGTSRTVPEPRIGLVHATIDMSTADSGVKAVEGCLAEFGRLDVLVNNVGRVGLALGSPTSPTPSGSSIGT